MAIFWQTYRTARCEEPAVGGAKFVLRTVRRETGQGGFSSLEVHRDSSFRKTDAALRFGLQAPVWVNTELVARFTAAALHLIFSVQDFVEIGYKPTKEFGF